MFLTIGRNELAKSVAKLSVSLPDSLAGFVENYRKRRGLKSRSQVFEEAIKLLRNRELEAVYREANSEYDEAWETAASDGLADETW
jgi:antitoxin ParD1/3/4